MKIVSFEKKNLKKHHIWIALIAVTILAIYSKQCYVYLFYILTGCIVCCK